MPITNLETWKTYEKVNQDEYSKACVDMARATMERLDSIPSNFPFDSHELLLEVTKGSGITGFQAGAIASMITSCHSRGKEFQKSWNSKYGADAGDTDNVVNPAIITVESKGNKEGSTNEGEESTNAPNGV